MNIPFHPTQWNKRRFDQPAFKGNPLNDAERDRARIIHSAAFRRLQAKTQVLGIGQSDFHRTRLTHTMEVAQLGFAITTRFERVRKFQRYRLMLPSIAQIEAICFAHDLGHPPFGHCGERALDYAMRCNGGFEGNGQSLRIVGELEPHTRDDRYTPARKYGLNLCRRTLFGILKYPAPYSRLKSVGARSSNGRPPKNWEPPKCYLDTESDLVQWILERLPKNDRKLLSSLSRTPTEELPGKTQYRSFDASIMDVADDIAYGMHDLEDAIALKLISEREFGAIVNEASLKWSTGSDVKRRDDLIEQLFGDLARDGNRKDAIGSLIAALIASVNIMRVEGFESPLLAFRAELNEEARDFLKVVQKELIDKKVIFTQEVQTLEFRGMKIVSDLFDAILSNPAKLLGATPRKRLDEGTDKYRVVCDFVAGMTDVYANRFHERLYGSRQASVFEKL